jgi:hypothetical protein
VNQPRGTQRYQPTQRDDEDALTRAVIELARRVAHPFFSWLGEHDSILLPHVSLCFPTLAARGRGKDGVPKSRAYLKGGPPARWKNKGAPPAAERPAIINSQQHDRATCHMTYH